MVIPEQALPIRRSPNLVESKNTKYLGEVGRLWICTSVCLSVHNVFLYAYHSYYSLLHHTRLYKGDPSPLHLPTPLTVVLRLNPNKPGTQPQHPPQNQHHSPPTLKKYV